MKCERNEIFLLKRSSGYWILPEFLNIRNNIPATKTQTQRLALFFFFFQNKTKQTHRTKLG